MDGLVIGITSASLSAGQNLNFAVGIKTIESFLKKENSPQRLREAESYVWWRIILKWVTTTILTLLGLALGGGWLILAIAIGVFSLIVWLVKGLYNLVAVLFRAMSKSRRNSIVAALCVLLVSAFIWFDHRLAGRGRIYSQEQTSEQAKVLDIEKYHTKTFTVVNVVDGDTLDIDIPDDKYEYTRIRLWGVDTPETKNPKTDVMYFGPQAAEFTAKSAFGKQVLIYLDTANHTRDKYNRLLAYVQLPDGKFLNEALLAEGFAYADRRFKHSFYNKYKQLEATARRAKKELWEKVTREQLPEWLQKEEPNLLLKK